MKRRTAIDTMCAAAARLGAWQQRHAAALTRLSEEFRLNVLAGMPEAEARAVYQRGHDALKPPRASDPISKQDWRRLDNLENRHHA